MNLTRNFSLLELTKSDTAIRKGIDNEPNADQVDKLKLLCENILQPVRDHLAGSRSLAVFGARNCVLQSAAQLIHSMPVQKRPTSKLWA